MALLFFLFMGGGIPRQKNKKKKGKAKNRAKKKSAQSERARSHRGGGGAFRNVKYITTPTFIHTNFGQSLDNYLV